MYCLLRAERWSLVSTVAFIYLMCLLMLLKWNDVCGVCEQVGPSMPSRFGCICLFFVLSFR